MADRFPMFMEFLEQVNGGEIMTAGKMMFNQAQKYHIARGGRIQAEKIQ
jgi:hypothetical protein